MSQVVKNTRWIMKGMQYLLLLGLFTSCNPKDQRAFRDSIKQRAVPSPTLDNGDGAHLEEFEIEDRVYLQKRPSPSESSFQSIQIPQLSGTGETWIPRSLLTREVQIKWSPDRKKVFVRGSAQWNHPSIQASGDISFLLAGNWNSDAGMSNLVMVRSGTKGTEPTAQVKGRVYCIEINEEARCISTLIEVFVRVRGMIFSDQVEKWSKPKTSPSEVADQTGNSEKKNEELINDEIEVVEQLDLEVVGGTTAENLDDLYEIEDIENAEDELPEEEVIQPQAPSPESLKRIALPKAESPEEKELNQILQKVFSVEGESEGESESENNAIQNDNNKKDDSDGLPANEDTSTKTNKKMQVSKSNLPVSSLEEKSKNEGKRLDVIPSPKPSKSKEANKNKTVESQSKSEKKLNNHKNSSDGNLENRNNNKQEVKKNQEERKLSQPFSSGSKQEEWKQKSGKQEPRKQNGKMVIQEIPIQERIKQIREEEESRRATEEEREEKGKTFSLLPPPIPQSKRHPEKPISSSVSESLQKNHSNQKPPLPIMRVRATPIDDRYSAFSKETVESASNSASHSLKPTKKPTRKKTTTSSTAKVPSSDDTEEVEEEEAIFPASPPPPPPSSLPQSAIPKVNIKNISKSSAASQLELQQHLRKPTGESEQELSERQSPLMGPFYSEQSVGYASRGHLQNASSLKVLIANIEKQKLLGKFPLRMAYPKEKAYFGNYSSMEYLLKASYWLNKLRPGLTLEVNDISTQRGGYLRPHRSHQNGLDMDIGYFFKGINSGYYGTSALTKNKKGVSSQFDQTLQWQFFKTMMKYYQKQISMIFVHPKVKHAMCSEAKKAGELAGGESSMDPIVFDTLRRLVPDPSGGHHNHFHTRLKCPASNSLEASKKNGKVRPKKPCLDSVNDLPAFTGCWKKRA